MVQRQPAVCRFSYYGYMKRRNKTRVVTFSGNVNASGNLTPLMRIHPHTQTHFSVSPELVPLHSMTVIEGHRAAVGNGIKTKLLGMLRIPWTDVLSPAEGKYLSGQTGPSRWLVLGMINSPAECCSLCPQGGDGIKERTVSSRGKTPPASGDRDC